MTSRPSPQAKPASFSASPAQTSSDPSWKGLAPYEQDLMTEQDGQAMLARFLEAGRKAEAYFRARKAEQDAAKQGSAA